MRFRMMFEADFESEEFALGFAKQVAEIYRDQGLTLVELQRERIDVWWTRVPLESQPLEVAS